MRKMIKKILLILGILILSAAAFFVYKIGPGNILGMIRYDQREEGNLRVGDPAPGVPLVSLDGRNHAKLSSYIGEKPLVVIFGSFT